MKILTNIRFFKLAGIAQTLSSLSSYVQKQSDSKKLELVGVEIIRSNDPKAMPSVKESKENSFKVITAAIPHPDIKDLIKRTKNIANVQDALDPIVDQYQEIICHEKPDAVLLNGTYYLPWCLFLAAKNIVKNIVLHYHGSLTKETEHYPEPMKMIFRQMEKIFDSDRLRYIFPSLLAKNTVAKEVFRREPKHFCVLPNPIPLHFFNAVKKTDGLARHIGAIVRWRHIKNISFIERFAVHNAHLIKGVTLNILTDLMTVANVPSHVRRLVKFARPMESTRLARFYSKMDVVICPSRFETYGNVAQEAVACGTPALISKNMGVAETFKKFGIDRWITDFSSPAGVLHAIEAAAADEVGIGLRQELKNELNPDRIHGMLLNYVMSGQN